MASNAFRIRDESEIVGALAAEIHPSKFVSTQSEGPTSPKPAISEGSGVTPRRLRDVLDAAKATTMAEELNRPELDAKIAASEARADTKIARIEGKLDTLLTAINGKFELLDTHIGSLNSSFDSQIGNLRKDVDRARDETKDSRLVLIAVIIGSALALGGLLVALATYGDAMFGRGMSVRDVIYATVQEMQLVKPDAPKTPH